MIKFIDLFAGMGGTRCGFELAAKELGVETVCVFTSEIKAHAIKSLLQNHPGEKIHGDITQIDAKTIPDFDFLLGGFPCQAFSTAGKRWGFADTRGTLFFEIERILKEKRPAGFLLENVEGLTTHDNGNTLRVILTHLTDLGYKVNYRVLNSKNFGVAQERKRIYIVGARNETVSLTGFKYSKALIKDILQANQPISESPFVKRLLDKFTLEQLYGKAIKDKRGGIDNIHSWDIELRGHVSAEQAMLLNSLLKERRKKIWAEQIGIDWMDGMPLTTKQISTFFKADNLQALLDDLATKGYLKLEHPKRKIVKDNGNGTSTSQRVYDETKPKGYNIVAGKLSFEVSKVLNPNGIAPTLVATDMQRLYVPDTGGLRKFTLREGLHLFGYPEEYKLNLNENEAFDLLGNTVVVPVIKAISQRLIEQHLDNILK